MPHRKLKEILQNQELAYVSTKTAVVEAARLMNERNIGALLVIDDGDLKGIFTERDALRRIITAERDPAATQIGEVMTTDVISLDGGQLGFDAVRMMDEMKIRHVVVTGLDGAGYGIASIRDFAQSELASFEKELDFERHVWNSI